MKRILVAAALVAAGTAQADYTVDMKSIDAKGVGKSIGTVKIAAGPSGGVVFTPNLKGLPAGERGFHVHQNADCSPKRSSCMRHWPRQLARGSGRWRCEEKRRIGLRGVSGARRRPSGRCRQLLRSAAHPMRARALATT